APVTGYLAADSEDGTVRRFVELPAGSRKEVALYVRPASFARAIGVTFESSDGAQSSAEAEVRVLERTTGHVAVVGDGGGNLRPQLIARATGLPDPIPMTPADLPDRPEPLRGIETIVWAADSSGLREAQRRSLERWIAAGGQLVVLGGPDWQARAAGFGELLPVDGLAAVDDASLAPLADWTGGDQPAGVTRLTASVGTPRDGAVELVGSDDGAVFAAIARGAGRVAWLGIDLATEPFRAWPGAAVLWGRLIPDERLESRMIGTGPAEEEVINFMTQALANLPALEVPPAELLLAVIVGYILLIGPVSYVVLRRLDRRELAWVTAPLLVLVFSAGSYGIGASMKGSEIIVNEIAVVRSTTGGTAASVSSYAGIYSPTRSSYDLTVRGDALFSALRNTAFDPGLAAPATYATEQGDPSRLRGLSVSVFGLQAVRAETVVPYTPSLHVDWSFGVGVIEGTVVNDGSTRIEDVAVISRSGGVLVGTLEPGASEDFSLSVRNLGGSMASEMVYGFANFNATTPEGREEQVRRQVIDSLVGYGSGWPVQFGSAGGGIDQGPFVVGWQTDTSPYPVEIDGHEVQRYGQAVEVLSGLPRLGPGAVSLEPIQMATEVVSTAGDVAEGEPGYLTLGEGEVVFRVSLPVEASRLAPTKVTLLAGGDPSSVLLNQGGQVSLLPPGYRLSVYDMVAADWVDVGDLSQTGRFQVDDPGRILDAAGRILLRVSGSQVPEGTGQMPVYASAAVEGVI
ncbi:MAG TPA: hypothetical protein VK736_10140, partial [Candidatus Binatia bacterium]|nr:hypothetical protein [Candidatus Binatia bacterium]